MIVVIPKADVRSHDFALTRFLMNLFKLANVVVINQYRSRSYFIFLLPSDMIAYRKAKFKAKVI